MVEVNEGETICSFSLMAPMPNMVSSLQPSRGYSGGRPWEPTPNTRVRLCDGFWTDVVLALLLKGNSADLSFVATAHLDCEPGAGLFGEWRVL